MRIILIHLGKTIPDYVLINLKHSVHVFGEKLVFISDNQNVLDEANRLGISTCIHASEFSLSELETIIESTDELIRSSIQRFGILKAVIQKLECKVVYIESDVLVFEDFPIGDFEKIENDLAYSLVSNGAGIASVLFVKDLDACTKMMDFFASELSKNGFLTDMELLWRYKVHYPKRVFVLPTTLEELSRKSEELEIDFLGEMKLNPGVFSGVFDSATWGQYLTGEHEVNSLGFRPLFHQQKHHFVRPWRHAIKIDLKGFINVSLHGESVPLYCLHIHSKDLAFFGNEKLFKLQESIVQSNKGMRFKFVPSIRNLTNFRGGARNLIMLSGDRWLTKMSNEL